MREGKYDVEVEDDRVELPYLHSEEMDDESGHRIFHLSTRQRICSRDRQSKLVVNVEDEYCVTNMYHRDGIFPGTMSGT